MDDAVLGGLAVAGLLVTLAFIPELLRHRAVLVPLAAGGILTAAALAVDARAPVEGTAPKVEELLELAGVVMFLCAMWLRWTGGRLAVDVAAGRSPGLVPTDPD